MATPQSTTSYEEPASNKKLEQITFRFCSECSNMLYPKEDAEAHKLQFTCRTCQYTEDAQSTCVFRNALNSSSGETAGVTQDVGSDPTVSESEVALPPVMCVHCGCIINCSVCGLAAAELCLLPSRRNEMESMGMCQFVMDWDADEYDEELMEKNVVDADVSSDDAETGTDGAETDTGSSLNS